MSMVQGEWNPSTGLTTIPFVVDEDGLLAFKKLEAMLRPLLSRESPETELSRLVIDLAHDYVSCFPDILEQEYGV